jgi:hypothetical protein
MTTNFLDYRFQGYIVNNDPLNKYIFVDSIRDVCGADPDNFETLIKRLLSTIHYLHQPGSSSYQRAVGGDGFFDLIVMLAESGNSVAIEMLSRVAQS